MKRPPFTPLLLGAAGLIPPALLAWVAWNDTGAFGPVAGGFALVYAALILSFLGGTWWAFACREERPRLLLLLIAVLPSLLAWAALGMFSIRDAGLAISAAIVVSPLVDWGIQRRGLAPGWWLGLRVPLSLGLAALTALVVLAG